MSQKSRQGLFADDSQRALARVGGEVPKRPKGAGRRILFTVLLWLAIFATVVYLTTR